MDKTIFGYEVAIDLINCNERIKIEEELHRYAKELCEVIDMKPFGKCQTPYFGEKSEITKGYSLLQFVETSSITGHFSEHYKSAHINIFSCKKFDMERATLFTKKFFGGKLITENCLVRYCTDNN